MKVLKTYCIVFLLGCLSVAGAATWVAHSQKLGISDNLLGRTVIATLQKESQNQFLVVGDLQISATITATTATNLNLGFKRFQIGHTEASVTVPGKVYYGFDLHDLKSKDITFDQGVMTVGLPAITVFAAEPDLEAAHTVITQTMLQHLRPRAKDLVQDAAYKELCEVLKQQGEEYLKHNVQPRINAARALTKLLSPSVHTEKIHIKEYHFKLKTGEILIIPAQGG